MSIKEDIKEVKEQAQDLETQVKEHSLAWEMLHDYKMENITLKVLLGISIMVNVLIAIIK